MADNVTQGSATGTGDQSKETSKASKDDKSIDTKSDDKKDSKDTNVKSKSVLDKESGNVSEKPVKVDQKSDNNNKNEKLDKRVVKELVDESGEKPTETPEEPNKLSKLDLNDLTVKMRDVSFSYDSKDKILNNINMTFPKGAIYGLLGPSGCGKTTLLKLILGLKSPKSGTIEVNGRPPRHSDNHIPGPGVGFQPQEIAMYGEFTIKEALNYFAQIYGMNATVKQKRIEFLVKFLSLPNPDRLIKNLSGGQQRRASLAVAIIHSPPFLILDEPTAGVDPMLRERVWGHLVELSETEKTSIMITTHYVEEARRAHIIALIRSGTILAEQSPQYLLTYYEVFSLEEVFLNVCKAEEMTDAKPTPKSFTETIGQKGLPSTTPTEASKPEKTATVQTKTKSNSTVISRFLALTHKNVMRLWRQKLMFLAILILPALTLTLFCLCIGKTPTNLKIAYYNSESVTNANFGSQFLAKIDTNIINLIKCESEDEALDTVRDGKTYGALVIPAKFTSALQQRAAATGFVVSNQILDESTIQFYGDLTDLIIYQTVFKTLHEAEVAFQMSVMAIATAGTGIKPNPKAMLPLVEMRAVYGSTTPQFRDFGTPSFIICVSYIISMALTALNMVSERKEGLLDRTIIAGVSIPEILIAEIVIQYVVLIGQLVILLFVIFMVFDVMNKGSIILIILLATLQGACGMAYGLFVSAVSSTEETALMLCVASFVPYLVISGVLWPLEGMNFMLQTISKFTPQTLPIISLRNIMLKGWGLSYTLVWSGFLVTIGWLIVFIILTTIFSSFSG